MSQEINAKCNICEYEGHADFEKGGTIICGECLKEFLFKNGIGTLQPIKSAKNNE